MYVIIERSGGTNMYLHCEISRIGHKALAMKFDTKEQAEEFMATLPEWRQIDARIEKI